MHHLDTRTLLKKLSPEVIMHRNFVCTLEKKSMCSTFTKMNWVCLAVTYNIHTKFELISMHHLVAIVFTHTHTYITVRKAYK